MAEVEKPEKIPVFVELIGEPEVGKTHFACLSPRPFIIDTTAWQEARPIVLKVLGGLGLKDRYAPARDWKSLVEAVGRACSSERVATVVIDTSADLQTLSARDWLASHGRERVYPITLYGHIRDKIDSVIKEVLLSCRNLVFTSQMKDEYNPDGSRTGRRVRDGYKRASFQADLRLYIYLKEGKRHYQFLKNRFVDRLSESWRSELGSPSWRALMEATGLPEEVWIL